MSGEIAGKPLPEDRRRVLIVTGMSGAGRQTALKAFEDLGYEAVDNLPLSLLRDLVRNSPQRSTDPLAVGVDVRARDFSVGQFFGELDALAGRGDLALHVLFFDCDTDALRRRFTETRRRHPFAKGGSVTDGIERERQMLVSVRDRAHRVIDTTDMVPGEMKPLLDFRYGPNHEAGLAVSVTSFSFRQGLPREADLVFDVRFLRNPHYDGNLRPLTGLDRPVADFIREDPDFPAFMANLKALLEPLLPRFRAEGKSYLTIAVGCTGGRHRAVFVSEEIGAWLAAAGVRCAVSHRTLRTSAGTAA